MAESAKGLNRTLSCNQREYSSYISFSISSSLFVLYLSHLNPFFSLCLFFVYFFFPFSFSTFPLIHVLHFWCVSRLMSIFVYHRRILCELVLPFLISSCMHLHALHISTRWCASTRAQTRMLMRARELEMVTT